MFVNQLGVAIAREREAGIVKLCDHALQFDAIDQKDRQRAALAADMVQKCGLHILTRISARRRADCLARRCADCLARRRACRGFVVLRFQVLTWGLSSSS